MGFVAVEVKQCDQSFKKVKKDLEDSKMVLTKLMKMESDAALKVFEQEKQIMEEQTKLNSEDKTKLKEVKILELYHGSCESFEQVLSEGLDQRNLKHFGHFGRGIYFSDSPAFARIEAESASGPRIIYRCRVLLGFSKVYPKDETDVNLTREPRTNMSGKLVKYDSVEGRVGDFDQYVVYERRRILALYAVMYDTHEPLPSLPLVLKSKNHKKVSEADDSDGGSEGGGSECGSEFNESSHSLDEQVDVETKIKKKKHKRASKIPQNINKVKQEAFAYMLDNKKSFSQSQYQNLLQLFLKTYLDDPGDDFRPLKGRDQSVSQLVEEFCKTSKCTNNDEAKIFLELNDWDVNKAVLNCITTIK